MFISSAGPRVVLNDGPNGFIFAPSSMEEQLLCQHLQLGFGFDHGVGMAGHGFDAWSSGMRAKAEPEDDWFHECGNGGVGFATQDSYVGMDPILGGHCVKNDYQPGVSVPASLASDGSADHSLVARPMSEDDGFWGAGAGGPSVDDGMSTMMAAQARWASFQNAVPYVAPHSLPVVDMNFMAVASDAAEFPAGPGSVYGSLSSNGASEMLDSMSLSHDGSSSPWTPAARRSEQVAAGMSTDAWTMGQNAISSTVSPKMLKLNPTPTPPSSSSESVHTSFLSFGPAETPQDAYEAPMPGPAHPQPSGSNCKPRKLLPDRPRWIPILPSDAARPVPAGAQSPGRSRNHGQKPGGHKADKPKGKRAAVDSHYGDGSAVAAPQPEFAAQDADASFEEERTRKDTFLVQNKRAGMTYKEIRLKGGFIEAESTLRGRFRTLTKNKEQRVRKPEWEEKDDRLLRKAVRRLAKGDPVANKIPWKLVAEYIVDNGGSYHFGNTTCRKRWDYLVSRDRADGK